MRPNAGAMESMSSNPTCFSVIASAVSDRCGRESGNQGFRRFHCGSLFRLKAALGTAPDDACFGNKSQHRDNIHSSSVDRSPSGKPSSRAFRMRLKIFPERVLGNVSRNRMTSGLAIGPISDAT